MKFPVPFLIASICLVGMARSGLGQEQTGPPGPPGPPPSGDSAIHPLAVKHCSACHQPPRPGSMTKKTWLSNFNLMAGWMREKNLPVVPEEMNALYQDYLANSPESFPPVPDDFADARLSFEKRAVGKPALGERPQITHINLVDLDQDGRLGALVCDNEAGQISLIEHENGEWRETAIVPVKAAVKTAVFDFEGDGDLDIAVASLGDIMPSDKLIGEAHLLINDGSGAFQPYTLIRGVARIADIQPGDFDGDGDTDFVIAKFGWRKSGGVMWLEQVEPGVFRPVEIVTLNGPMRMEVLDYDGDGDLDFIVLFTQEHESIVLFENDGKGQFQNRILAQARHPSFGSSSFQMTDLDGDGDRDILYTNGDMMDENSEWKPYHGVRWFENVEGEYRIRELAIMPGCYSARALDMDGDGDLDVVASSMNFFWGELELPSLIWLENDGKQAFTKRRIDYTPSNLATMDVGDLDHDGIPDIIAGGMHLPGPLGRVGRLSVWLGRGPGNQSK